MVAAMPFKNKDDQRAASKRFYDANSEAVRARVKATKELYDRNTKKAIQDYKENHPCSDCSEFYPFFVMEFDHVPGRGKKVIDISRALALRWKLERILKEIEKCDVVCANCHRIRTFSKRSKPGATKRPLAYKNSKK